MLFRHCCTDGFVECVLSIENHYNRDQSQINIYKSNIIQRLEAQGYTIITHCKWKPSFKNIDDFAEDIAVFVNDEDGYFEYKTKLRHDTINNHIDDAVNSIERQMKKYIDENTTKETQQ